ncbi:MAG: acyl-CoA dehydratase activase [Eubacteriaceae bacterium]|jgi:predicted CoA-substrate-specific enzyme activase|nr:acyl-CoA dehydratase activase [Eubacteriaceae bacterium]
MKKYLIGIDIGSTCAKTAVMDRQKNIIYKFQQPTGWSSIDTAQNILGDINRLGIDTGEAVIVATGYGRISVPYADKCVTEITCHAAGARYIYGVEKAVVIDIGGQDTKIICIENGVVADFLMNDKCSAGTGRFLEIMANTLSVSPEDLCEMARNGSDTSISSMCTVFAESEVISLIGRGEKRENIAFAVMDSIASKVASQAEHLIPREAPTVCITGGLCEFTYLRELLADKLHCSVVSSAGGRYAGAAGAALYGEKLI